MSLPLRKIELSDFPTPKPAAEAQPTPFRDLVPIFHQAIAFFQAKKGLRGLNALSILPKDLRQQIENKMALILDIEDSGAKRALENPPSIELRDRPTSYQRALAVSFVAIERIQEAAIKNEWSASEIQAMELELLGQIKNQKNELMAAVRCFKQHFHAYVTMRRAEHSFKRLFTIGPDNESGIKFMSVVDPQIVKRVERQLAHLMHRVKFADLSESFLCEPGGLIVSPKMKAEAIASFVNETVLTALRVLENTQSMISDSSLIFKERRLVDRVLEFLPVEDLATLQEVHSCFKDPSKSSLMKREEWKHIQLGRLMNQSWYVEENYMLPYLTENGDMEYGVGRLKLCHLAEIAARLRQGDKRNIEISIYTGGPRLFVDPAYLMRLIGDESFKIEREAYIAQLSKIFIRDVGPLTEKNRLVIHFLTSPQQKGEAMEAWIAQLREEALKNLS